MADIEGDEGGTAVADPAVTPEDLERLRREVQEEREREMTALRDQLGGLDVQIAQIQRDMPLELAGTLAGLQRQIGELATRTDLGPAVEEIRGNLTALQARVTRDIQPVVERLDHDLEEITRDGGILATLRGDFDTRMRAETAARGNLRTEVLGWVGDRRGLTTTLTQDVGTAQTAANNAANHATGARGVASIGLIISAVLLILGGVGLYLTRSDLQGVASLAGGIASEMGGYDPSKPVGQRIPGWQELQQLPDKVLSVEGAIEVLAAGHNEMARAGESHRVRNGLKDALTPAQIIYGWKDPKTGKVHLSAGEQANIAQATAFRVGEAADARAGIDPKESRADHYALAERPYGNRDGDLEKDADPVKAYRAKRR